MRASHMKSRAIRDTLNVEQVPTARGGRMWRPTALRAVLAVETTVHREAVLWWYAPTMRGVLARSA
jgi:hypothetical protein